MLDNKDIVKNFLMAVMRVIASTTSVSYALAMVNGFIRKNSSTYPFLKDIKVNKINDVEVSESLNSVEPKEIAKALNQLLGTLFITDEVKEAIMTGMDQELISDLQGFGVMI